MIFFCRNNTASLFIKIEKHDLLNISLIVDFIASLSHYGPMQEITLTFVVVSSVSSSSSSSRRMVTNSLLEDVRFDLLGSLRRCLLIKIRRYNRIAFLHIFFLPHKFELIVVENIEKGEEKKKKERYI